MNLLTDAWIPVREKNDYQEVSLQDVLCSDKDWRISCHRDDFEMAALQLLICLTQVVLLPENLGELREREKASLDPAIYQKAIQPFIDWFDLLHPTQPFMQTRGVDAKELTPIQKLFAGLPEGNNPAYFNPVGEISKIGLNYAAIALFNQAANSPSFGGGFKGGLRGMAPITVLIKGDHLRSTIWRNVISREQLEESGLFTDKDFPNWVQVVKKGQKIYSHEIGTCRGLFWQPAHIELSVKKKNTIDDCSGQAIATYVDGFLKEKFTYELQDTWPHPHSPREWVTKKGETAMKFKSFTTTAPAWTQMTNYLIEKESEKEGYTPPLAVSQFSRLFPGEPLNLMIGGYRNKQASILQRRHEMLSLAKGWENHLEDMQEIVQIALEIKDVLSKKIYGFAKQIQMEKPGGLSDRARDQFFLRSEATMHSVMREMDFDAFEATLSDLIKKLSDLAQNIYENLSTPYQHSPKMLEAYVKTRAGIRKGLREIKYKYTQEGVAV